MPFSEKQKRLDGLVPAARVVAEASWLSLKEIAESVVGMSFLTQPKYSETCVAVVAGACVGLALARFPWDNLPDAAVREIIEQTISKLREPRTPSAEDREALGEEALSALGSLWEGEAAATSASMTLRLVADYDAEAQERGEKRIPADELASPIGYSVLINILDREPSDEKARIAPALGNIVLQGFADWWL